MLRTIVLTILLPFPLIAAIPFPDWAAEQIAGDLAHFSQGFSRQELDSICCQVDGQFVITDPQYPLHREQFIDRIVIKNGQVSHLNPDAFAPRINAVLDCLSQLSAIRTLPDTDFIVTLEDALWGEAELNIFCIPRAYDLPVFCVAKAYDKPGILWPDFEMMDGYIYYLPHLDSLFANEPAWEKKWSNAIWRGSTTGGTYTFDNWWQFPRSRLVLYSLAHPNVVDARFTGSFWQCEDGVAQLLQQKGLVGSYVPIADHLRYRYLIDIDGNSCTWSRFYWILRSQSVPLKITSKDIQWYYGGLEPWYHYVPVLNDFSDLEQQVEYLRNNDAHAREIAQNGREFALTYLTHEMALQYMYFSLLEYTKLLKNN